jgi:PIN domain nuclease of toxin-antitoxin system
MPARARRLVQDAVDRSQQIAVSSISMWEIALLVERGRLELAIDAETWLTAVQSLAFLTYVPVDNALAIRAVNLPDFPNRDPADRFIVATALSLGATLITADRRMRAYDALSTVWD